MSKPTNLTYSFSTNGWIDIYDEGKEIGQVEISSEEQSLYSYRGWKFFKWLYALYLNEKVYYMHFNEQMIVKISSDVNQEYDGHMHGWNSNTITVFWDGDVRNSYDNGVIKEVRKVIKLLNKKSKEERNEKLPETRED